MEQQLQNLIQSKMKEGQILVPARLQAGLALLERLRETPSLKLDDHLARAKSGLVSHETFGNKAHARLGLALVNKNHGRRSSNLQDWGQPLLDILKSKGFRKACETDRLALIESAQQIFGKQLRSILEQEPLQVQIRGRSAESVVSDVLDQAESKGKCGDVAQYLVGAKLRLRFKRDIAVRPVNKGDRKYRSDENARAGDFELSDSMIEVAVGLPDEKHLSQIVEALDSHNLEVWLLTRSHRVDVWKAELRQMLGLPELRRVVVAAIEAFVGQNVSELGEFSSKGKEHQFSALFSIYNDVWIASLGTPGIRVVVK